MTYYGDGSQLAEQISLFKEYLNQCANADIPKYDALYITISLCALVLIDNLENPKEEAREFLESALKKSFEIKEFYPTFTIREEL